MSEKAISEAGYCHGCGRPLVRDSKPAGYSTATGEPQWTYSCPVIRWWKLGQYQHDQKVYGYR